MKINILITFLFLLLGTSSLARVFTLHNESKYDALKIKLMVGSAAQYESDAPFKQVGGGYITFDQYGKIVDGVASLYIYNAHSMKLLKSCRLNDATANLHLNFNGKSLRPQIGKNGKSGAPRGANEEPFSLEGNIKASKICK